jgi:hypothetical protein
MKSRKAAPQLKHGFNMNNQKIFRWVIILFTLLMIALAIDMASNTTAPWNKKKVSRGQ